MDGQSTDITLRVGLESFDDLLDIRRDPDGYRVKRFEDIGQWCAETFAKCRHPKWQLDNGFDDLTDEMHWRKRKWPQSVVNLSGSGHKRELGMAPRGWCWPVNGLPAGGFRPVPSSTPRRWRAHTPATSASSR